MITLIASLALDAALNPKTCASARGGCVLIELEIRALM